MKSEDVEINMDGELEYVEGTNELYTGKSETHYENGNLQHSGQYENGLMEGVWMKMKRTTKEAILSYSVTVE